MVVVILCIGIAIIVVVYLRRKQHAKKVDLTRYARSFCKVIKLFRIPKHIYQSHYIKLHSNGLKNVDAFIVETDTSSQMNVPLPDCKLSSSCVS